MSLLQFHFWCCDKNTLKNALGKKGFISSPNSSSQSIFLGKSRRKLAAVHISSTFKNREKQVYACSFACFATVQLNFITFVQFSTLYLLNCATQSGLCLPALNDLIKTISIDMSTIKTNGDNSSLSLSSSDSKCVKLKTTDCKEEKRGDKY